VRTCRVLTLLGILITCAPRIAAADWLIAPFIGLTFNGETTLIDPEGGAQKTHWSLGGAVSWLGQSPIGVEGLFQYTPGFFQNKNPSDFDEVPPVPIVDSRVIATMGNAVLTIPRSWNEYGLRPFVSGGVGVLSASSTDFISLLPVHENLFGYNVGGGAIGFLTQRVGVRFDLRYFGTLKANEVDSGAASVGPPRLSFWTASVGLVLRY
jgi:hypothetical protein